MTRKGKNVHNLMLLGVFVAASFLVGISAFILKQKGSFSPKNTFAATNFDQYCEGGVYYVKSTKDGSRISCGRAPNCGGVSYESIANGDGRNKAECWVEDYYGGDRCKAYCAGNVPLCCYRLAETKNYLDCTWPERGYCLPSQCEGVGQGCGVPIRSWCVSEANCVSSVNDIPYISLSDRLEGRSGGGAIPTATQTPSTPTSRPTNTPTPRPGVPTATPTTRPNVTPTSAPIGPPTNTGTPVAANPTEPPIYISTLVKAPTTAYTYISPTPTNPAQVARFPIFGWGNNTASDTTDENNSQNSSPFSFQIPEIDIKIGSPKELARAVLSPERVSVVAEKTDKPLASVKDGFLTVKSYDARLEDAIKNWITRITVYISDLLT